MAFLPVVWDAPLEGEVIDLDLHCKDAHLTVLKRRAGVVVHLSAGHWAGKLVHALLYRYQAISPVGEGERPGIV